MGFLKIAEGELLSNDIPAHEALADVEVTNRFIKLAESLRKIAPRSDDFLYFTAIMLHGAEASLVDPKTGEAKKDKQGNVITGGFSDDWKWSCTDISIDPYSNQNGDIFPSSELKKAYAKWRGRPLCINHQSSDVEGVRGIIIDTHWDDKYKRVVGLCALDKKSYPELAQKVKAGYANNVSMGTAVGRALCTVCQKAAVTEKDYCDCIRSRKGQRINGVKVGEINLDLSPIELSLVVTPADQQAKVLKIVASMNNYVDQRSLLLEEKDRVETEKLAKLDDSIKSVESQLNRLFSECSDSSCQFVRGEDGHIKMVKSAQEQPAYSWDDFFATAREIDGADDYEKHDLFDSLNHMRQLLRVEDLRNDPTKLTTFVDVMGSKNKYLHEKILQPVLEELKSTQVGGHNPPMQDNQFTSPNGPDKDTGLGGLVPAIMPQDEQMTGRRYNDGQPSEKGPKPNKGGDTGPELGSASDKFDFGNMASNQETLMAKGGKITALADIEENLNLLLKQTQEIEVEMNKMKDNLNNTNSVAVITDKAATAEDFKMNEARLKLRAAQRKALLEKQAYHQGTEEPKEYKKDPGAAKARMEDKQMHQDKAMGGADGAAPGDEATKKKLLRADLEQRALNRRAYFQGTEEPKEYKKDPGAAKARQDDKQMHQDKAMGGADGAFPGDEAAKKKLLRAELVPGTLRTKFTKVRNADGSYNKQASYFEIFAGENKLLKATAEEIYGEELEQAVAEGSEKTAWDVLSSPEYGKEVMATIRTEGFEKVSYLLKGAQAAPAMPELPPAMDAAPAGDAPMGDEGKKVEVDANEIMSLVGTMEDTLGELESKVTKANPDEVAPASVDKSDEAAESVGTELAASVRSIGLEVHAELDRSADELALLAEYFQKSASLSDAKKTELNKLAAEAVADGKALLEEAETILAIAGKVPPGLAAFQKKKEEAKGKGKDKKEDKKEDKKDAKKDKKEDKKDEKKKDKKKSKKAELAEALLKLATEIAAEDEGEDLVATAEADEMDKDMKELGLLPENAADDKEDCGMCGAAMDAEHACTASSAKDELVREALAARKAKREALLKSAEEKKYDVTPDMHGHIGEAHKGHENPTTELDVKPAGDGAMVEGVDKIHDDVMDAAEAAPTGKQGSSDVEVKEAEIKAALEIDLKVKKAEEDKTKFRVKLRRAYDLGLQMQEKSMISRTKEALDVQVDEIMKFDDLAFESYKRVVSNTNAVVKTASTKSVPQVGVREDNSSPEDAGAPESLTDKLKNMW